MTNFLLGVLVGWIFVTPTTLFLLALVSLNSKRKQEQTVSDEWLRLMKQLENE